MPSLSPAGSSVLQRSVISVQSWLVRIHRSLPAKSVKAVYQRALLSLVVPPFEVQMALYSSFVPVMDASQGSRALPNHLPV